MNNRNSNYRNSPDYLPRPFALIDVNAKPGSPKRIVASFDTPEEAQTERRWLGNHGVAVEVEEVEPPRDFEPGYAELKVGWVLAGMIADRGPLMAPIVCDDESTIRSLFESMGVPSVMLFPTAARASIELTSIELGTAIHEAIAAGLPHAPPRTVPNDAEKEKARELIRKGYKQTSSKYRHVARLPEGMNGIEALQEVAPEVYARFLAQVEQMAAATYLRIYARPEDRETLTPAEFKAFKAAGGEPA